MTTPQPGWYDDPHDSNAQRYWDGQDWTPHRQRKPISRTTPPPVPRPTVPPPPVTPTLPPRLACRPRRINTRSGHRRVAGRESEKEREEKRN